MIQKTDQVFQERIDELLLLEQRVDQRGEKFLEITSAYQEKSQKALDDLLGKVGGIDKGLAKMNAASESVNRYLTLSATHAERATHLFLSVVVAAVLFIAGLLWWSNHVTDDLVDARAELASLNIKLQHKPVIVNVHGKDFVRVVLETETTLTQGDSDMPGRYSEVWHVR